MAANEKPTQLSVVEEPDKEEEDAIELRAITTRDLFTFIQYVVPKIDVARIRQIFNDMPAEDEHKEMYFRTAGIEVILMIVQVTTDQNVQKWIADLANMTLEQFLDSDIRTSFRIVSAMANNPDLRTIFTTLLQ